MTASPHQLARAHEELNQVNTVVDITNVTKTYGKVTALKKLTMHVEEGIFGLAGPNGSGKTTLIKILIGAIKPDKGGASVFGKDCWKESLEVRKHIGVLHERPMYPPEMSGLEFLTFVGRTYGFSKAEAKKKALGLLGWFGLRHAMDRNLGGYSAGMKQRLGLAQTLIGGPRLVILDEPTSNLDPPSRAKLRRDIANVHRQFNVSFIMSTHVLSEIEKMCHQVGIINKGSLVAMGSIKDLAEKYNVRRPDLEEIFLKATGTSLEEAEYAE